MESIQSIKQRFGIIGNSPTLNRAIEKAIQVAPTDISVLVTGESGVGKESIPKIIHQLSHRKHGKYIASRMTGSTRVRSLDISPKRYGSKYKRSIRSISS